MAEKNQPPIQRKSDKGKPAKTRDDRLKAALKANLARRKGQARARSDVQKGQAADKTGESEG